MWVRLFLKITARDLPPVRSANVIGEIAGTGAADEIVLLGAHLDSWDPGTGALDDAAGVAIVMEAARLIQEMKLAPRRTLRVVLYANEEFGLSGANVYAAGSAARGSVLVNATVPVYPVATFPKASNAVTATARSWRVRTAAEIPEKSSSRASRSRRGALSSSATGMSLPNPSRL